MVCRVRNGTTLGTTGASLALLQIARVSKSLTSVPGNNEKTLFLEYDDVSSNRAVLRKRHPLNSGVANVHLLEIWDDLAIITIIAVVAHLGSAGRLRALLYSKECKSLPTKMKHNSKRRLLLSDMLLVLGKVPYLSDCPARFVCTYIVQVMSWNGSDTQHTPSASLNHMIT